MIRLTVARIALGLAALMVFCLVARPLLPIDETRYLAVAWEMRLSGDALHLTRNFAPYAHKPPLLFWLINFVWTFGVFELTGRMVGPAFGVAAVVGTAALARRIWTGQVGTGIRSAAVLAGFSVFVLYASATMFDALLTCAVLLGMAAIWGIGTGKGPRTGEGVYPWLILGAAMGLGTLAKGPVILIHLLPVLLLMRFWAPHAPRRAVLWRGFALALVVGLVIVGLWLGAALLSADAAFRHELLWSQTVDRVAGGMAHDRPFWFLFAALPLLLFPFGWSWRLWRAVPAAWREDNGVRFCAIWAVSGLILFSFVSSKQAHYLVPELPAVALIFGRLLSQPGRVGRGYFFAPMMILVLAAAALAIAYGALPVHGLPADLTPRVLTGFALLLAAIAVVVLRLPFLPGHLGLGWGVVIAVHLLIWSSGIGARYDSHLLAARLAEGRAGGLAVAGMTYNAEVNFALRLTQPVATPKTADELAAWARANPAGLIFGPVERAGIAAPPRDQIPYDDEIIGVWPASAVGG